MRGHHRAGWGLVLWGLTMWGGLLPGLTGCGGMESSVQTPSSTPSAGEQLSLLLDELWALNMRTYPQWATYEGIRDYDHALSDASLEAEEAYVQQIEAIAERAQAIDADMLSVVDQDTRRMLLLSAERQRATLVCRDATWNISGLGGPQTDYPMMPVFFVIRHADDLGNLERRYRATEVQVGQIIENLRTGVAEGNAPTRSNIDRVLAQLDTHLALPLNDDPMLALKFAEDSSPAFDTSGLRDAVENVVRPALSRYRDVLRDEVLPHARPDQGIADLSFGSACYQARMLQHIGPGFDAEALHQRGLDELAVLHRGMVEVGIELGLDAPSHQDVIAYVKGQPGHFASSEEELIEMNTAVVARAAENMPRAFGRIPETPVHVRPLEKHRAADAPAAYYYSAPEDGSRPAIYYVNTLHPETRPLFNLEALAFHEAIPGHHLQIALAKALPDLHMWRRNAGQTAYTEGWALYAEVLADELGLYSSPLTRFGMYNYQAWRAARLVVDTGLHHYGWSRQQAIDFMLENTALPLGEIENEVDRYIAWPGQALAYMVGRMEIQALRTLAETELGEGFVLHDFHDAVHARGSVPLVILRENIESWITSRR